MKTPITYYGGKLSLWHHIGPMIPKHMVYTEVFFGGGTVFWSKNPAKNETINDRLDYVINFYRVIQNSFRPLKLLIDQSLMSRSTHRQAYRILMNRDSNRIVRAWAFWYCSNMSFSQKIGGGMKYSNDVSVAPAIVLKNKKREFTDLLVERIENTSIENDDALRVLTSRDVKDSFHYLDPPYVGADMGHYKGYKESDYIDLLDVMSDLNGKFIMSNYRSDLLDDYVKNNSWNYTEITKRLQAPKKKNQNKIEALVWNFNKQGVQIPLNFKK